MQTKWRKRRRRKGPLLRRLWRLNCNKVTEALPCTHHPLLHPQSCQNPRRLSIFNIVLKGAMNLCSLNLNNRNLSLFATNISPFPQRNQYGWKRPFLAIQERWILFKTEHRKRSENKVLKFRFSSYKSIVVRATVKKNDENSSPSSEVLPHLCGNCTKVSEILAFCGIFLVYGVD